MRQLLQRIPRPEILANLSARALLLYFGAEALHATVTDPNDRRFSGKGIAVRNALLVGAFSMFLPILYHLSSKRRTFPWAADAVMITVPVADMAGNSLDLYNAYGWFDSVTHFYGTAAVGALVAMATSGRSLRPAPYRWLVAVGTTTVLHVLLEMQEYWTDTFFGTHNVEGLEDTEGDILAGMVGAFSGVALAETFRVLRPMRAEAGRLGAVLDPLAAHDDNPIPGNAEVASGTGAGSR